jgi:hypothetical protein
MSFSTRLLVSLGLFILICISLAAASNSALSGAPMVQVSERPSLHTTIIPPVLETDSNPGKPISVVISSPASQIEEYVDHTVTIYNADSTRTVWINLFAGPFGRFPSGNECQPTQCDGSSCCPSVSCPNAKCGTTSCNQGDVPLPFDGGFLLNPGELKNVTVQVASDRITTGSGGLTVWARTGCRPTGNPDYPLICNSANCDLDYAPHSRVACGGIGSQPPATKAEITFNGNYNLDSYDISLVDGWNVPMWLEPVSGNYDKTTNPYYCRYSGGYLDLGPLADKELPLMVDRKNNAIAGVWSACKYSALVDPKQQDPAFCCIGEYADAKKCQSNTVNWPKDKQTAQFFAKYYPKAYAFAYGDPTGGYFSCKPNDNNPINYTLTIFGPNRSQAEFEAVSKVLLNPGEPVIINHTGPGVRMHLTSEVSGMHEVHFAIIPSNLPPEDPEDYVLQIPTMGLVYKVHATLSEDNLSHLTLYFPYTDDDLRRYGLLEDSLRIFYYNPDMKQWDKLPGSVDTENKMVSGETDRLGYFIISGSAVDPSRGEIHLKPGWNCISTAKQLAPGNNNASIFSNVPSSGHSVLKYNQTSGWVSLKETDILKPLDGIWLFAEKSSTVSLQFDTNPDPDPPSSWLGSGWNSIGFSATVPYSARDTFHSVSDLWKYCVGYNETKQQYETMIEKGGSGEFSDTRLLSPYHGYWVYMTAEGELIGV